MRLKRIEVNAFGGIHPGSPVVLDFTKGKFVVASGDMGTGKTSLLNAMLVGCGQLSREANDLAFVNKESGKLDINVEFVGKDRLNYNVRCTKSKFTLTYEGEVIPEPITKMKELLGVVGVSPMEIKNKKVEDIVKWLSAYTNTSAEDFVKKLSKFKDNIRLARDTRAAARKSAKGLSEYLNNEVMYNEWEISEQKYSKKVDFNALNIEMKIARDRKDNYRRAEERMETLKKRKVEIEEQIARLVAEAQEVDEKIEIGQQYLLDNETANDECRKLEQTYTNAATEAGNYSKWQDIKRKKTELDEFETISQQADIQEKELLRQVKELQAEILPDINGVELVTEDNYDTGELQKEGLYWNGVNTSQMSESEWWSVVMQIWKKYKVKIVAIDNMQSLGSRGVELLKQLHKDGAYILAAEMDRNRKELEIQYD